MIATCSLTAYVQGYACQLSRFMLKTEGMLIFTAYFFSKVAQLLILELFTTDIPRFKYKIQPRTGLRKFTHGSD